MRVMASGVEHPFPLLALSFPLGFLPRAGRLGYNHLCAASPPLSPLPAELPYLLTLLYFAPGAFPPRFTGSFVNCSPARTGGQVKCSRRKVSLVGAAPGSGAVQVRRGGAFQ